MIDHAVCYMNGKVHTNAIENFWSLLKWTLGRTYVSERPGHLFHHLDEEAFRLKQRKLGDGGRFQQVMDAVARKRLECAKLVS